MCLSSPKVASAPPTAAPPPPTKTAEKVENNALKSKDKSKRRGVSALTVRRSPSVNTNSSGSGANISY